MPTALTLTASGQLNFNKQLMEHLDIRAGERVLIKKLPGKSLKIEAEKNKTALMSLAGSLKSKVKLADDALQQAIKQSYVQAGMQGLK